MDADWLPSLLSVLIVALSTREHFNELESNLPEGGYAIHATRAKWMSVLSAWKRAQVPQAPLLLACADGASSEGQCIVDVAYGFWGEIFSTPARVDERVWEQLDTCIPRCVWPELPTYTVSDVEGFLRVHKRTAPGPDGIHYCASAPLIAHEVHAVWEAWIEEENIFESHCHSNVVLLPKVQGIALQP
eukprot:2907049-Amphidinium_carterae.1